MCRIRFAIFAILVGFCTAADIASADEAEAWTALHAGRHVALMRHADAPARASGSMTAPLSAISAPRDARTPQGSARGSDRKGLRSKESSARRGAAAWTRRWNWDRRTRADIWQCGRAERSKRVPDRQRAIIDKWTGSGILLVVTHGANIRALTGISPASGEIVVVRSGSGGSSERVGRLILD
jgi:hypothetical protein